MSEVYQRFILCVCSKSVLQSHLLCLAVFGKLVLIYLYSVLLTVLCYTGLVLQHITNRLQGVKEYTHVHNDYIHNKFWFSFWFYVFFRLRYDQCPSDILQFDFIFIFDYMQVFCMKLLGQEVLPKLAVKLLIYSIISVCWFQ